MLRVLDVLRQRGQREQYVRRADEGTHGGAMRRCNGWKEDMGPTRFLPRFDGGS
jgi:hypothetical protein